MSRQDHIDADNQIAAYALGALDLEDLPELQASLEASPVRQEELRQLRDVVALLPYAAQPVEPPDRVRRALMARIAASVPQAPQPPQSVASTTNRRKAWLVPALAAAFAVVVLALSGLTITLGSSVARLDQTNRELVGALDGLQQTLSDTRQRQEVLAAQLSAGQRQIEAVSAELAASEQRIAQLNQELSVSQEQIAQLNDQRVQDEYVISFVSAPGVATRALTPPQPGPNARAEMYMYPGNPSAVVLFSGLEPLEPGKVYQFWLADGATQVAGGTFVADTSGIGRIIVQAPREVNAFSQVMVTVEPEGGSTFPSDTVVLEGNL